MPYLTKYELFYSGDPPMILPSSNIAVCNHPFINNLSDCPVCGQKMVLRNKLDLFHEVLLLMVPDLEEYQSWNEWELTLLAMSRDFPNRELYIYGSGEKGGDEWGWQIKNGKKYKMIYNPDFGAMGHQTFVLKALSEMTRL